MTQTFFMKVAYPAEVLLEKFRQVGVLVVAGCDGWITERAFPSAGMWPAAILGIAILYICTLNDRPWWNGWCGFAFGCGFFLPHLTWAQYAVGNIPWVALSILQACFSAAVMVVFTYARRISTGPVLFAALWTCGEIARSTVPFGGFPWGRLAFSQSQSPLGRVAWLGGASAVSFIVAACGALVGIALVALYQRRFLRFGTLMTVVLLLVAGGWIIPLDTRPETGVVTVAAVQGNVSNPGLDAFANQEEVLRNHLQGTLDLANDSRTIDVVLWPENASDIDPLTTPRVAQMIDDAAQTVGAPIVVGTQEFVEPEQRYNISFVWYPGVGLGDKYAKQHPAPFAEYIPLRQWVRPFSDAVDLVHTDMTPGREPGILDITIDSLGRTVTFGDVICFEVAYDDLVRTSVREGAEILVVQTNNASFGPTNESTQQLAMSRLRAIETGRTTIQISTVGVSAIIAPNGVDLEHTDLFTADSMVATVGLRTSLTPAVRWGHLIVPTLLTLTLTLLIGGYLTHRKTS